MCTCGSVLRVRLATRTIYMNLLRGSQPFDARERSSAIFAWLVIVFISVKLVIDAEEKKNVRDLLSWFNTSHSNTPLRTSHSPSGSHKSLLWDLRRKFKTLFIHTYIQLLQHSTMLASYITSFLHISRHETVIVCCSIHICILPSNFDTICCPPILIDFWKLTFSSACWIFSASVWRANKCTWQGRYANVTNLQFLQFTSNSRIQWWHWNRYRNQIKKLNDVEGNTFVRCNVTYCKNDK